MAMPYDFTKAKGSTFVQLTGAFPRTFSKQLGFWYLGDGSLQDLRVRLVDNQGETFQLTVGPVGVGWQRVIMDLRTPSQSMASWGNAKNGRIDYPVRLQSILVDASSNALTKRGSISVGPVFTLAQPYAYALRFQTLSGSLWAAWAGSSGKAVTARAPVNREMQLVQAGLSSTLQPAQGNVALPLSERPLYLR